MQVMHNALVFRCKRMHVTLESIISKPFVVQMETQRGRYYIGFSSKIAFEVWYHSVPDHEKTFHEVVRDGYQKFRLDIDYTGDTESTEQCLKTSVAKLDKWFRRRGTIPDLIVYSSSHAMCCQQARTSYHVVVVNCVLESAAHCQEMFFDIFGRLTPGLDANVYKRTQNFRIQGSSKLNHNNPKKICGSHRPLCDGLIGQAKSRVRVPRACSSVPMVQSAIWGDEFRVRCVKSLDETSMILLDRIRPSYCDQCLRVHDNENAYVVCREDDFRLVCRRFDAQPF